MIKIDQRDMDILKLRADNKLLRKALCHKLDGYQAGMLIGDFLIRLKKAVEEIILQKEEEKYYHYGYASALDDALDIIYKNVPEAKPGTISIVRGDTAYDFGYDGDGWD